MPPERERHGPRRRAWVVAALVLALGTLLVLVLLEGWLAGRAAAP